MSSAWLALVVLLAASVAGVTYAAYWYIPSSDSEYDSPFLAANPSEFIEVAGFRVHYLERGAGPTLLLVHGGGTWLYSFRHNLEPLARDFRVIALDMPGHGYTEPSTPDPVYDFATTDRVLRELLDAKGISEASVVGHSWGGDWALHFAQQHPERVRKLVLIGASGLPGDDRLEWKLLRYPVIGELMAKSFRRKHAEWGLRAAFVDQRIVTPEMVSEIYAPVSAAENRLAQVHYSRDLDWREIVRDIPGTQIPTLVLWGARDEYGPVSDGQALVDALPDGRLEVVPDAGHNVHEEKPEDMNVRIAAFFGSGE